MWYFATSWQMKRQTCYCVCLISHNNLEYNYTTVYGVLCKVNHSHVLYLFQEKITENHNINNVVFVPPLDFIPIGIMFLCLNIKQWGKIWNNNKIYMRNINVVYQPLQSTISQIKNHKRCWNLIINRTEILLLFTLKNAQCT